MQEAHLPSGLVSQVRLVGCVKDIPWLAEEQRMIAKGKYLT